MRLSMDREGCWRNSVWTGDDISSRDQKGCWRPGITTGDDEPVQGSETRLNKQCRDRWRRGHPRTGKDAEETDLNRWRRACSRTEKEAEATASGPAKMGRPGIGKGVGLTRGKGPENLFILQDQVSGAWSCLQSTTSRQQHHQSPEVYTPWWGPFIIKSGGV